MGNESPSSGGGAARGALAAAIVLLVVLAAFLLTHRFRTAETKAPASPTPAIPGGPIRNPFEGQSAVKGDMQFATVLLGITLLEGGPQAVTGEQAKKIDAVITGQNPRQRIAAYARKVVEGLLTDGQKKLLALRYEKLRADERVIYHPPKAKEQERFYAWLVEKAGGGKAEDLKVPDDFVCTDVEGAKPVPYADLLVQFREEIEKDPAVRLSTDQVRRLLPCFKTYRGLVYTDEGLILEILTAGQKSAIDGKVSVPGVRIPERKELEAAITKIVAARRK